MLPSTVRRVPRHTSRRANRRIRAATRKNVERAAAHPSREISERLLRLDREWDIERTLEANAASVGLVGIGLGAFVSRWFLILPAAVTAFLFEHALQGWCPPLPLFRRLGFRTSREIDHERVALKALRGDFRPTNRRRSPRGALSEARRR